MRLDAAGSIACRPLRPFRSPPTELVVIRWWTDGGRPLFVRAASSTQVRADRTPPAPDFGCLLLLLARRFWSFPQAIWSVRRFVSVRLGSYDRAWPSSDEWCWFLPCDSDPCVHPLLFALFFLDYLWIWMENAVQMSFWRRIDSVPCFASEVIKLQCFYLCHGLLVARRVFSTSLVFVVEVVWFSQ